MDPAVKRYVDAVRHAQAAETILGGDLFEVLWREADRLGWLLGEEQVEEARRFFTANEPPAG